MSSPFFSLTKKSLRLKIILMAVGIFLLTPFVAAAYGWNWGINDFNSTIQINADSTITVTEHIEVDFTQEEHHGIFRIIPVNYTDTKGQKSSIPISILSITDDKGNNWKYSESNDGDYLSIKIGDPNILLNKVTTYNITYKAERAIGNYDDHDELYWNATGDKWEAPIEKAEATIKLPKSLDPKDLRATCYTGSYGATLKNCSADIIDGQTFQFGTKPKGDNSPALNVSEGLTIVAGFPKGIVVPTPPTPEQIYAAAPLQEKILLTILYNWGLFIPVILAAIMFYLWYTKGRDPRTTRTTIMPIYTAPDNLRPTEIGTIIDETVDMRDISSAMIDLAVRGYLKIVETKSKVFLFETTTYKFILLKKEFQNDNTLEEYEKKILTAIFKEGTERNLSDLNNEFYKEIPGIKDLIYGGLVKKGYFPTNPDKIRGIYRGIGIALLIITFFGTGPLFIISPSLVFGLGASGIIMFIFAKRMPAKTLKGTEMRYKILGLEEFINTAEKDRLKFQEKENIFEKILPYAMTLGIAAKWTKAFEGIYKTAPSWYESNDPYFMSHFSTYYFLSRLDSLSTHMNSTFTSSPRSSGSGFGGGGFSGGGGGGGGGGAW